MIHTNILNNVAHLSYWIRGERREGGGGGGGGWLINADDQIIGCHSKTLILQPSDFMTFIYWEMWVQF